jgi:hypothetical protein
MSPDAETIEESDPTLSPGAEWHSDPIHLRHGQRARVTVVGKRKVYAQVFPAEDYIEFRNHAKHVAGFRFGTDKPAFTQEIVPQSTNDYYVVVKNGLFTPRQRVHVRLIVEDPPEAGSVAPQR